MAKNKYYYKDKNNSTLLFEEDIELDLIELNPHLEQITKAQYDIYVEIKELKANLTKTDYQSHKFADGALSEQEYAPIRTQRQAWRDRINELEQELEQ